MTSNEKALVAALESDITIWEQEAQFFEMFVQDVEMMGANSVPGREYARGLRSRIAEHRALVERVKAG